MLVRAAKRKTHFATRSRISPEQLYLPWLCPTLCRSQQGQRRNIAIDSQSLGLPSRKRRNSNEGQSKPLRRSLATAVDRPLDEIQFGSLNNTPPPVPPTFGSPNVLSELRPFDHSSPVRVGGSFAGQPMRFRMGHSGVGGELSEILSILRACLQVGRLERAGVILKRIATLEAMNDEQLLQLHNEYIQAAVYELYTKPRPAAIQTLHKWFELEIRNKELPLNAETIAFMLKASLQTPAGMRRNRLVRRYMDIGKQKDLGLEVLGQSSILSAEDLNEITHICPDYNSEGPMLKDFSDSLESDEVEILYEEATSVEPAVPDVRTTKQKGLGLKSLKQSLSLFSQETSMNLNLQNRSIEEKRMIQAQLEEDGITAAIQRWREENAHLTEIGFDTALQTKSFGARMWKWQLALDQALKNELEKVAEAEEKHRIIADDVERVAYGPFLRILPTEKLAALTILSCMTALSAGGVDKGMTLSSSIMAIAKSVEEECAFEAAQANHKITSHFGGAKAQEVRRFSATQLRKSIRLRGSDSRPAPDLTDGATEAIHQRSWPTAIKAKVGAFLMSALIETAKIPVTLEHPETKQVITQLQPAFSHSHQYKMGKKVGMVIANRKIVEQLKREPVHSLLAKHLPMLVPPEPWTDFDKGGFISHPAKIMRIKHGDKDQRHYAEAAIDNGDMTQTFKGLDVLGKTSWRINRPVFDVMLEAWNSGEAIANIAAENPKFDVPPEPEASNDPLERRKWIRAVKLVENAKSGLHSQRCFQNFQLEIARALRNHEFFFPHNIDFRGRAYPIPPYFNHMGADHCRGILKFGRGRELGESGLKWLKVHLANVFGYDKASLKEREAFAEENITSIYDSALKPLNGSRWWLKAEDPWQCLAACMELKNALESPEPTKFVSHLPVHQDGTCNGLQHYAALGGDAWGAQQVNLEPGDRPADVYSAVANLVKESIAADKEKGNPYAQILAGRITRKVVKQTVMTNVYGVTYIGAKAQVRKQLVAAYPDLPNDETVNPGVLSAYVATKIFTALSTMFRGAHDIQYWLGECASRITRSLTPEQMDRLEGDWPTTALGSRTERRASQRSVFGVALEDPGEFRSSVIWTTPLHMPVVQPYRQSKTRMVQTNMQSISLSEPHRSSPISRRKQLQGFPPNFIHSLDATHMLLSALKCDEQGLTFAAVHDSFWTHASDVDSMNSILRDAFIRIHSENVIGRLAGEFRARYKDSMYLTKIHSGSALYKKIISLRKTRPKTSKPTKLAELLVERKRCRLLQSSDPAEVEEGKKMVTPGSLFEEMAREEDLSPEKDLANIGIGEISQRESRVHAIQETDFSGVGDHGDANPLPDNILAETGSGEEAEEDQELDDEAESDILSGSSRAFAKKVLPKRSSTTSMHTWVWLPLTFPSIPQKGDFDVSRLKNSEYFFS